MSFVVTNGGTRNIRARARTDIGDAGFHSLANCGQQIEIVETLQQAKGVPASDEDGVRTPYHFASFRRLLKRLNLITHLI